MTTLAETPKTTKAIKIEQEIQSLEHNIQRDFANIDHARVSSFKYFWPFLVLSFIEGCGGVLISGIDAFLRASRHEEYRSIQNIQLIVILLIFLALHIFGGMFARHMARKKNDYLEKEENSRIANIKKNEKKIVELKAQKKELLDEIPVETLIDEIAGDDRELMEVITAKTVELNKTEKVIENHSIEICRMRVEMLAEKRTSFYYFWPFFVVSFIAFFYLQGILYVAGLGSLSAFNSDYLPMMIAAHVFILLHIFGGVFARKMRDKYNQKIDDKNASMYEMIGKLQDEMAELEMKKRKILGELKVIEGKIPEI